MGSSQDRRDGGAVAVSEGPGGLLRERLAHRPYERRLEPEASLDDLDGELLREFVRRPSFQGLSVAEALEHLGLAEWRPRFEGLPDHTRGVLRLTNTALLLFGRRGGVFRHPRAGIRLFRVAGTEPLPGHERNVTQLATLNPPVLRALDEALMIGHTQVLRTETFTGMEFQVEPEIPDFAWREAITNAVAHRDYEIESRETEVWFYEDRVEIESPGGLAPPATEATLRDGVRASRNPLLVHALETAGRLGNRGKGIPRIYREMASKSLPPPEISSEGGLFTIRLRNDRPPGAPGWPNRPLRRAPIRNGP